MFKVRNNKNQPLRGGCKSIVGIESCISWNKQTVYVNGYNIQANR